MRIEEARLVAREAELERSLQPLRKAQEKRTRDLSAFQAHADAIRALGRGALGKVAEAQSVDLGQHVREMCPNVPASMQLDRYCCKGWLHKKGEVRASWKERWFVLNLQERKLMYFVNASETSNKGHIGLAEVTAVAAIPGEEALFAFAIVTSARNYQLRAPDSQCLDVWLKTIRTCCPIAGEGPVSLGEQEARIETIRRQADRDVAEANERVQQLTEQLQVERRRRVEAERLARAALQRGDAVVAQAGDVAKEEARRREEAERELQEKRQAEQAQTQKQLQDVDPRTIKHNQCCDAITVLARSAIDTKMWREARERVSFLLTSNEYARLWAVRAHKLSC